MKIDIVYPAQSMDDYVASLEEENTNISARNSKMLFPAFAGKIASLLVFVILLFLYYLVFLTMIYLVTGRGKNVIAFGLGIGALTCIVLTMLLKSWLSTFRQAFFQLFHLSKREETNTYSDYVSREDASKKKSEKIRFYRVCDNMKQGKIISASCSCIGDKCMVYISYIYQEEDKRASFSLPFRESSEIQNPVIHLDRGLVLFPKSK